MGKYTEVHSKIDIVFLETILKMTQNYDCLYKELREYIEYQKKNTR